MSNWPPNPNKAPDNNQPPKPQGQLSSPNTGGREWHLLETTLLASIEEQRRARRWSIISKLITLGFFLLLFMAISRACSEVEPGVGTMQANAPHIAVIDVQGVISPDDDANAYDISWALTDAYENEAAKAVVLNINSPGGSPVQSDEIWQTIMTLRAENPEKKTYAVIGDMGASGAYYIASAADEIYVNPSSLVGSIGVIMPSYNIEGLMDKVGVKERTFTAGEYKDILSISRPLTEFEEGHIERVLDNTHKHFIDAVKQGRGDRLVNPEANNLFSGLFWTGEQAIALGLADKTGGLRQVEKDLDIDNLVNYTPIDPVQELFGNFAIKLGAGIGSTLNMSLLSDEQSNGEMR